MRFLALDWEGSHKNPQLGCPVQCGIALMEDSEVIASDEWIIRQPVHYKTGKPTKEVDANALAISGITLEQMEREGLTPLESCNRLEKFVRQNEARSLRVLTFNASYDLATYRNHLFDGGGWHATERGVFSPYPEILGATWTCIMATARHLVNIPKYSLDSVAEHLGMSRETEIHGALEDAILAGRCYVEMLSRCKVTS